MTTGVVVAAVEEIPPGTGRMFQAGGRTVYVANVEGCFHAIDAVCPHRSAMLGQGTLEGRVITCPWHQWQFDVTTGRGITNPLAQVRSFRVEVIDGRVMVDMV